MIISGAIHIFGDNVDTDVIIPARHCITDDAEYLALHCMEDIAAGFYESCKSGDIIVAGKNFGCGSSREAAVLALTGCGIKCVIAKSFARLFYRNSVNNGLLVIETEHLRDNVNDSERLTVDTAALTITAENGYITAYSKNESSVVEEIISAGGLMKYYLRHYEKHDTGR